MVSMIELVYMNDITHCVARISVEGGAIDRGAGEVLLLRSVGCDLPLGCRARSRNHTIPVLVSECVS